MSDENPSGPTSASNQGNGDGLTYTERVEAMSKNIHRWLAGWFIIIGVAAFAGATFFWPQANAESSNSAGTLRPLATEAFPDSARESAAQVDSSFTLDSANVTGVSLPGKPEAPFSREQSILLVAFLFGILGGATHGFASLMNFRGQRRLFKSWTLWYFGRPLLGGMMAVIFYVVVRAGLFSGAASSNYAVNVYGVAAFSALAGLFTDAATEKLGEVFETIFATKGNGREGKLTPGK